MSGGTKLRNRAVKIRDQFGDKAALVRANLTHKSKTVKKVSAHLIYFTVPGSSGYHFKNESFLNTMQIFSSHLV